MPYLINLWKVQEFKITKQVHIFACLSVPFDPNSRFSKYDNKNSGLELGCPKPKEYEKRRSRKSCYSQTH